MNKKDLNLIKPKHANISDKFSWNLYKYMKNNKNHNKVFFSTWNQIDGSLVELDWNNLNMNNVIIGYGDAKKHIASGKRLRSVLCGVRCELGCYDYTPRDIIDITDEFWKRYKETGRCLITPHNDKLWIEGNKDRYIYINNTRKCKWCGKWQEKHIEKVQTIERKVKWS